jgi:hypothetical protein
MQLSVRPDDLAAAATALRRLHDMIARETQEFGDTAARLGTGLGPEAAESGRSVLLTAVHQADGVADQVATFAQGLSAAAAYYASLDAHALGRVTVVRR